MGMPVTFLLAPAWLPFPSRPPRPSSRSIWSSLAGSVTSLTQKWIDTQEQCKELYSQACWLNLIVSPSENLYFCLWNMSLFQIYHFLLQHWWLGACFSPQCLISYLESQLRTLVLILFLPMPEIKVMALTLGYLARFLMPPDILLAFLEALHCLPAWSFTCHTSLGILRSHTMHWSKPNLVEGSGLGALAFSWLAHHWCE